MAAAAVADPKRYRLQSSSEADYNKPMKKVDYVKRKMYEDMPYYPKLVVTKLQEET